MISLLGRVDPMPLMGPWSGSADAYLKWEARRVRRRRRRGRGVRRRHYGDGIANCRPGVLLAVRIRRCRRGSRESPAHEATFHEGIIGNGTCYGYIDNPSWYPQCLIVYRGFWPHADNCTAVREIQRTKQSTLILTQQFRAGHSSGRSNSRSR